MPQTDEAVSRFRTRIGDASWDMVLSEQDTREYDNAETGSGQGLNPFWGWSSLAYFMPLEFELGYDPTDLGNERLIALAADGLGLRLPERFTVPSPANIRQAR